jgi:predicted DNA binding protein
MSAFWGPERGRPTWAAVARRLGISDQAMSERLRRIEGCVARAVGRG